jgi:hypothetical protein
MLDKYTDVTISNDFKLYKFTSIGFKGSFVKVVRYYDLDFEDFYNLGFGDEHPITGDLDDLAITDNGDTQKVLATVAMTLYTFINHYPNAKIFIKGSTKARTRLYRIGIARHLSSIEMDFTIEGLLDSKWQNFRNDVQYDAFLIKKKR